MIYNYNDHAVAQIEARIIKEPHPQGCIEMKGSHKEGYPTIKYKRKVFKAVNWFWDYVHGIPPKGMHHCHKPECNNKGCINLAHIYIGTPYQNAADKPRRSHCGYGHAFNEENTGYAANAKGILCRYCKTCRKRMANLSRKHRRAYEKRQMEHNKPENWWKLFVEGK